MAFFSFILVSELLGIQVLSFSPATMGAKNVFLGEDQRILLKAVTGAALASHRCWSLEKLPALGDTLLSDTESSLIPAPHRHQPQERQRGRKVWM